MDFATDFKLTSKSGVSFFSRVKGGIKCIIFLQEAKRGENSVMKNGLV